MINSCDGILTDTLFHFCTGTLTASNFVRYPYDYEYCEVCH